MSIFNYAGNKFFDNEDYAFNAVPTSRVAFESSNMNFYQLPLDLIETPDMYVLIAEIPGVSKDRITITTKDDKLMIEGKKKKKVISNEDHYLIHERRNGLFKKMIQLPIDADSQSMSARIEDGLLVLSIPRVKNVNGAKYITIN
ncbi:heat shock protein HSP20 [Blastocystis sp. subtype 4]|uniref:heat shock protein HSP20 n=1 Tax=Blastocystis sp. subtype 4 TaxID=944170 RepID=UPI0007114E9D|nr:heat shock protein HSP20 [Blastocystis sp. subtype 4]KNB43300.1 heat shock protein HSP20 [Blastocystis sp. subtype 4]|eukprot:XP_014526735.1 heat shock protein HSP20 [Blastocystis sp. subtype 4]